MDSPSSASSNVWSDVANTTTGNTDAACSPPVEAQESPLYLRLGEIECIFSAFGRDLPILTHHRDQFYGLLSPRSQTDNTEARSPVTLGLRFIQFLFDNQISQDSIRPILRSFRRQYLRSTDIHTFLCSLPVSLDERRNALRTWYVARSKSSVDFEPTESALLKEAESGSARLYAVFGGQGANNTKCVSDLRELYFLYQPFLEDLFNEASAILQKLSQLPRTSDFYKNQTFDLEDWLKASQNVPDQRILAQAAFSFPLIGLISLAQYCITCKILNKTPRELRSCLKGVTGHSQGLVVAAAISCSNSWRSFHDNTKAAIEILFWIGFECQQATPRSSLSAAAIADSLEHGESQPSSLLGVQGLCGQQLENVVKEVNKHLGVKARLYIALANSRDKFVVAGPAKSLHGLNSYIRGLKADSDADQSRVPFSKRKPMVQHRFLPVNAPFHTPYLEEAYECIMTQLSSITFHSSKPTIPVFHTQYGHDLSKTDGNDLIKSVVNAITVCFHDWRAPLQCRDASHIVVFDKSVGSLVAQNKEGQGVQIIMASEIETSIQGAGSQAELFAQQPSEAFLKPASWEMRFQPQLTNIGNGQMRLETKLSKLLGLPPVMVAGMTPTTVHWDFVSTIMNAGYHAEIAGGGYLDAESMSTAIKKLASDIPPGRGITCNLIYVSPKAMAWQIPMIGQLIREGLPIDGLTIGAGVPSTEIAADYIMSLGLKHISFKPGSLSAIKQVIAIAQAHPEFPIILQWTGGRGGGHHSFEDFHEPLLQAYGQIRNCSNLVLVAGSGFGDATETFPYFVGTWAHKYGRCSMPIDGVLLGSRMMVAKEAHTSPQSKKLIIEAAGSDGWERTYTGEAGGVITVQSEMGQPIHKIATRGVKFWAEMDQTVFKLPKEKRLAQLAKNRDQILQRLNDDFAKPWFGKDHSGRAVNVSDMTYLQVLIRLIELMYVSRQSRWIDQTYQRLVFDFVIRTAERLPCDKDFSMSALRDPQRFVRDLVAACPMAETRHLHPEDVTFFVHQCRKRDQKPVNFIPVLDENLETWFKKDSLWQSEDIEAVVGQDAGRVCILQGPVAARFSVRGDESAKDILDGICAQHIKMMQENNVHGDSLESQCDAMISNGSLGIKANCSSQDFPCEALSIHKPEWIKAVLDKEFIIRGKLRVKNPLRALFALAGKISSHHEENIPEVRIFNERRKLLARVRCNENSQISVDLYHQSHEDGESAILPFRFTFNDRMSPIFLNEDMDHRNDHIKSFYSKVWLSSDLSNSELLESAFQGPETILTGEMLQQFLSTVGKAYPNDQIMNSTANSVPIDFCIILAWEVLVRPLLAKDFDGDLLRLVHRANIFEYARDATPLQLGDKLSTRSFVEAVVIEPVGTSVVVKASIQRNEKDVVTVTSTFLCKEWFPNLSSTFRHTEEPDILVRVVTSTDETILRDREWLLLDEPSLGLLGKRLLFRLSTHMIYHSARLVNRLQIRGSVFEICTNSQVQRIGSVEFIAVGCQGNPVMDFLERKSEPTTSRIDLKSPGWMGQSSVDITMPDSNEGYARISKDHNPIHVSAIFAAWANLSGIISHGMFTSAITRRMLEHLVGDSERVRFRRWSASFVGMVLPGDKLTLNFQHVAMAGGRMVIQVTLRNKDTDAQVLEGEAEIEQEKTAYLFTGQGSQEKNMGMALYDASPAARKVWDEADKVLEEAYGELSLFRCPALLNLESGWSIKTIVRDNPKTLTVRFGGKRGRQIRKNYLKMRIDETRPDGRTVSVPVLKALNDRSNSYTFSDPQGLIFSTQFAQPAIVLLELAAFEDMCSKGLIQNRGMYAGHSLGEYASLAALADFLPPEALMGLLFYRGLAMQVAMERDHEGRTEYSMIAVSPNRVGKCKETAVILA